MKFEKFLNNKTGRVVASVLLGFGLATLFRQVCKGKCCIVKKAIPIKEIENQVYKYNNKCYKYNSVPVKCNSKNTIEFA